MNSFTGTLHQQDHVARIDPVAMLKCRFVNLFTVVSTWHERAHQRRQLLELDDRLLADIGISRDQAQARASRPFWRD
jgi:uncharacterized protein YjiS (DUF1127 family)